MYLVKRTRWISIAVGAITFGIVVCVSLLTGAAQQPVTTQRNSPAIPEADGQVRGQPMGDQTPIDDIVRMVERVAP